MTMKPSSMTRNRSQVYSIGNYLMTGKVLGKGHFARVEEATHRIVGKKVAIKIIDLTLIKEEYARRNLHREPRVMSRLRHPCIAALYETMMHGPRLYVVMEEAGGGDLCTHVISTRGPSRGLPESRARSLAAQLVSAVKHMHSRGVVHRDLKMENIMLDCTKQFIKIVDFGLSNIWSSGAALHTPCGSLEYAAPELFVDGRRYGPEVDLWSIGVIVYGMVTGGLPFTAPDVGGEGRSRPQLRAAITRGFTKKQRTALNCASNECKTFIQHLLEPNADLRMKIEEASRHRWVRRPGMRMKTNPLNALDPKANGEMFRQISELSGRAVMEVISEIKTDPFGALGGMYNIKTHLYQLQSVPGVDLLWSNLPQEQRAASPAEYVNRFDTDISPSTSKVVNSTANIAPINTLKLFQAQTNSRKSAILSNRTQNEAFSKFQQKKEEHKKEAEKTRLNFSHVGTVHNALKNNVQTPVNSTRRMLDKILHENGDCYIDPRLPCINEHAIADVADTSKFKSTLTRTPCVRKVSMESSRLTGCPLKTTEVKRTEFYRRAGDGLPSWRASGGGQAPARILMQSNSIKRASLGNIVSPHSSTNSHCKSERNMPIGWCSTKSTVKDPPHLQRFRRSTPLK